MCDNTAILFPLSLCTLLCSVKMIREKNGTQHQEQQQLVSHQVHLQPSSYYFTLTWLWERLPSFFFTSEEQSWLDFDSSSMMLYSRTSKSTSTSTRGAPTTLTEQVVQWKRNKKYFLPFWAATLYDQVDKIEIEESLSCSVCMCVVCSWRKWQVFCTGQKSKDDVSSPAYIDTRRTHTRRH